MFGQFDAGAPRIKQIEQFEFLAVIGTRRVAKPGSDSPMSFRKNVLGTQSFVEAPLGARRRMEVGRESLRKTIGERLHEDGVVVVVLPFESTRQPIGAETGGDGERAQIIGGSGRARGDEIGKLQIWLSIGDRLLLTQHVEPHDLTGPLRVAIHDDVIVLAGGGPKAVDAVRLE